MKLSIEQRRVFEDLIRKKLEHHVCQLCQSSHWSVGELIACTDHDPTYEASGEMVQLICDNCGQVLLFDASRIKQWQSAPTGFELM